MGLTDDLADLGSCWEVNLILDHARPKQSDMSGLHSLDQDMSRLRRSHDAFIVQ